MLTRRLNFRLLEMRMPRSSSFSVRDILDLPQMKASSPLTTSTAEETPTANGASNDGLSDAMHTDDVASAGKKAPTLTRDAEINRIQQSK